MMRMPEQVTISSSDLSDEEKRLLELLELQAHNAALRREGILQAALIRKLQQGAAERG